MCEQCFLFYILFVELFVGPSKYIWKMALPESFLKKLGTYTHYFLERTFTGEYILHDVPNLTLCNLIFNSAVKF